MLFYVLEADTTWVASYLRGTCSATTVTANRGERGVFEISIPSKAEVVNVTSKMLFEAIHDGIQVLDCKGLCS